uniref:Uncharacterized protein n=1 Tax=Strongyloides papillosus TaxID=174720 RepID=A0A0N5BYP6_STREA
MNLYDLLKIVSTMELLSDPDAAAYQIFLLDRKFFKGWANDKLTRENATEAILKKIAESLGYSITNFKMESKNMVTSTPIPMPINAVRKEKTSVDQLSEIHEITPIRSAAKELNISKEKKNNVSEKDITSQTVLTINTTGTASEDRSNKSNETSTNSTIASSNCSTPPICNILLEVIENSENLGSLKKRVNEGSIYLFDVNDVYGYIFLIKSSENNVKNAYKRRLPANYTKILSYVSCLNSFFKAADESKMKEMRIFTGDELIISIFKDISENSYELIGGGTLATRDKFTKLKKLVMSNFISLDIIYVKNENVKTPLTEIKKLALSFQKKFNDEGTNTIQQNVKLNEAFEKR